MSYSVYIKYRSKRYKLPVNPEEIKKKLVTAAERRGYDTSQLKWIEQL